MSTVCTQQDVDTGTEVYYINTKDKNKVSTCFSFKCTNQVHYFFPIFFTDTCVLYRTSVVILMLDVLLQWLND